MLIFILPFRNLSMIHLQYIFLKLAQVHRGPQWRSGWHCCCWKCCPICLFHPTIWFDQLCAFCHVHHRNLLENLAKFCNLMYYCFHLLIWKEADKTYWFPTYTKPYWNTEAPTFPQLIVLKTKKNATYICISRVAWWLIFQFLCFLFKGSNNFMMCLVNLGCSDSAGTCNWDDC